MKGHVLNCGYLPLVDCAPLLIAKELGFAAEEGLDLRLIKQPSWSALRDNLILGQLDAAQMLAPMPIALRLGIGGVRADVDVLSVLSVNGTVFGLSQALISALDPVPYGDPDAILAKLAQHGKTLRIGVPFHASTHRLLLSYLLARCPDIKTDVITVPPPRMAAAIADGQVDAFWVGEPWGSVAVKNNAAAIVLTGSQIWSFAPEKVLAARSNWVTDNPEPTRALMRATYKAGQWLGQRSNAALAVDILARSEHLDLTDDLIDPGISGEVTLDPTMGPRHIDNFLLFFRNASQFPWRSQAAWIATQLGADDNSIADAKRCFRSDLYRENLGSLGVDLPGASEKVEGALAHETAVASTRGNMILGPDAFFDGKTFDFHG